MRIRSLAFSGVGPYRERQLIDFDQLGDSGLYLINGPTGAGKSTIIDAICFALYGRLASDESDPARLRSHFAGPSDPTEVELVFETSAGVFRVTRSPEHLRAKARGEGETKAHARCTLTRIGPDGSEEAVATNVSSANAELAAVVGLTRDQFVQTVVLPQGEFATFLTADTRDRAEILKRIFDTALFERVVAILSEDARQARAARDEATARITAAIHVLAALTGIDDDEREGLVQLAADGLDADLLERVHAHEPLLVERGERAAAEATRAREAADAADTERGRAKAEADAAAAEEQAAEALRVAVAGVALAQDAIDVHRDLGVAMTIELDTCPDPRVWRQRASAAATAAGRLEALVGVEAAVQAWPAKEAQAKADLDELAATRQALVARQEELPALVAALEATRGTRPTVEETARVQQREASLRDLAREYERLDAEEARLARLQQDAAAALLAAEESAARSSQASRSYREGIAAELSVSLESGHPCPVCGSIDHPLPAVHDGSPVTFEEMERRARESTTDHAKAHQASADVEACASGIAAARAALTTPRAELVTAQAEAADQQQDLAAREQHAAEAEDALADLRVESETMGNRLASLDTQASLAEAALAQTAAEISDSEQTIAASRGGFPSVADLRAAVLTLESALSGMADHQAAAQAAATSHDQARAALASHPPREGFADTAAAQTAWLAADALRQEAEQERAAVAKHLADVVAQSAEIQARCIERAALTAGQADLIALADTFAAGRGSDFGLHIHILRSMFDTVMELANRRFESLLGGRYRLVPADADSGDRRSLQGLGVSVRDGLTGTIRPARSLSGGETFCAALALALGLSDAVRLNAGGIEIASLFIDEGFGSLDADQLEDVMTMLGHLSRDGRRVGVISHVDSMKSSIIERIDVTPATEGRPAVLCVSWMS